MTIAATTHMGEKEVHLFIYIDFVVASECC